MSAKAIKWAFAQKVGSSTGKAVLVALADYANDEGYCWPSFATLAAKTELTRRAVIAWIEKLEAGGLIVRESCHRQEGGHTSNRYQLLVNSIQPRVNESHPSECITFTGPGESDSPPRCTSFTPEVNEVHPPPAAPPSEDHASRGLPADPRVSNPHLTVIEPPLRPPRGPVRAEDEPPTVVSGRGGGESPTQAGMRPSGLILPGQLSPAEREVACKLLTGIDSATAQAVLDVLAAAIQAGEIRKSPLAVLRGLVARWRLGDFDPGPGLHVADTRERQRRAEVHARARLARSKAAVPVAAVAEDVPSEARGPEQGLIALRSVKERLGRPSRPTVARLSHEAGQESVNEIDSVEPHALAGVPE